MNRVTRLTVVSVGGALLLAGCVGPPPELAVAPAMHQQSAMIYSQADVVLDETFAELAAADAKLDPALLGERVAGDALLVRTAQYKVAAAASDHQPDVLPADTQAIYVSAAQTWPRVMSAVSVQPGDNLTPVVSLWVQDDISTPYTLRSWAHMIPGASMPAMPSDVVGAQQLDLTDASLTPTARETVENYLEFLRAGRDSELAAQFSADTYAERLFAARDVLSSAASGAGGAYVDTIQADFDGTFVMATSDGGALVFTPVDIASSFSVSNAKVSVAEPDRPLVEGTLDARVTHRYRDLVVFYIPGPGVDSLPGVVAADHHLVRVTAD
jgi:hypothetical protein